MLPFACGSYPFPLGIRTDLLKPKRLNEFRVEDFLNPTRIRITGNFFSILFNLGKFTLFEQRDQYTVKQEPNNGPIT